MTRVAALLLVCAGVLLAGCGSSDSGSSEPAAAVDTTVQPAAPSPDGGGRPKRGGAPVLQGTYTKLTGGRVDLARYRGDVVLVVNTATECGFTPQFGGLEALYKARRSSGFTLLGFPSNDFAQESRNDGEIAEFCKANFGVTFPMFSRTEVTGDDAAPLFRRLGAEAGEPEWNFNKYLLDRDGKVVARFGSGTEPDAPELTEKVDALLKKS